MEADLQLDVPLYIAGPLVLFCLLLAAYLSAAETAITGASRRAQGFGRSKSNPKGLA